MDIRHSNSSIDTYKSCPTKWNFSQLVGLIPLGGGGQHDLDFGSAWARSQEVLYGPGGTVKKAQAAFLDEYPPERYPTVLPYWAVGKTARNGWNAIRAYAEHWREEDSNWEVLEVEKLSDVNALGETSRVVKLDLVFRDKRDGMVYGLDGKTTGKYLDRDYWAQFEPHSQIRQYVDYIKSKWGHCGGFIINAVSLRNRSKAYTPRSGPDKGIQQPAGDWFKFGRMLYAVNSNLVQMERENVDYWTSRIEQDIKADQFGYNTQQCKRGQIECEYRLICKDGLTWPRDEEAILEYYYRQCRQVYNDVGDRCRLELGHNGPCDKYAEKPIADDYDVETDEEEGVA